MGRAIFCVFWGPTKLSTKNETQDCRLLIFMYVLSSGHETGSSLVFNNLPGTAPVHPFFFLNKNLSFCNEFVQDKIESNLMAQEETWFISGFYFSFSSFVSFDISTEPNVGYKIGCDTLVEPKPDDMMDCQYSHVLCRFRNIFQESTIWSSHIQYPVVC